MPWWMVVAAGLVGLLVGGFLTSVVWRVPRHESVVGDGSRCPSCGRPVRGIDAIPVVSWLRLRGRCRDCGEPIPLRYPLVEVASGALFVALALRFGDSWELPAFWVFGAGLLALSAIDLEHFILPNRIVYPLAAVSVALLALAAVADGDGAALLRAVLAGLVGFGVLLVIHLISPRGMGFGDVKLSFVLGLFLGWLGWGELVLGLFLGFVYGAVIGMLLIATRVRSRKDHIPFGPFLAAGALTAVLWGTAILDWYAGR